MTLRKALAWSVSGQFSAAAITFGGSVVVARLLSPRDLGVYAVAAAIITVINTTAAFGVSTYVIRAKELLPTTLSSAFTLNGILASAVALLIFGVSVAQRDLFRADAIARVLAPLALVPLIAIFEFRPSVMLQRDMNFRMLGLISGGKALCANVFVIALALDGFSYMSLAYGSLASSLFSAAAACLVGRRHIGFALSLAEARQMTGFGIKMMSVGGINTLAARLSDIILGNLLGLAALGLYSRASNLSSQIFDNVYGAITRVLFVQLSAEYRGRGVLRDVFLRGFEMITALIWPMQIGLAVLAGPAISILYGQKWLSAALPLSLLMCAQFVVVCFGMNWELFVLRNETSRMARFELARAVVGVGAFSIGCLVSISCAAVGRVAESLFGLALFLPHMTRIAGTEPGELTRIYLRSAALTCVAVAPSVLLMIESGWSPRTPPLAIAGTILLGIALWASLLWVQDHPVLAEIKLLARKARSRMPGAASNAA
ncbi:oligosaccharide flippase family protein [Lichenicoccus sp.]|uniref:oligosaccharide flippase family protein n=1 Tax=Lichenicoccus sp. TaxID=2781899 RepID=UPI003D0AB05F